jgi:hypothetical protein
VGGWGSNPRPADYEKHGLTLQVRCLHGYRGVLPPMALIAPFAQVTRSTNRSTPRQGNPGCQIQNVTADGLDMPGLRRRVADERTNASP